MRSRIFAFLLLVPLGACIFPDFDALGGGQSSSGGDASATADAARDGATPTDPRDATTDGTVTSDAGDGCTALHGPKMVRVPQNFCIDSTEVTNAQYKEFVLNGDLAAQSGVCAWNTTNPRGFKPDAYLWYDGYPNIKDNGPVQGVNFCDAKAYCAWAGKRLCGKVGGGGLVSSSPLVRGSHAESDSEWYVACAHGSAKQVYPYGDAFKAGACNIGQNVSNYGAVDVASFPQCVGGYPGIFDMTGNVMEWIDNCEGGAGDPKLQRCIAQGGPWNFERDAATCDFGEIPERQESSTPQIGFRCCKDVSP